MARLFTCGFERRTSLEFSGYVVGNQYATVGFATPGRSGISGTYYWTSDESGFGSNGNHSSDYDFTPTSEIYIGLAVAFIGGIATDKIIVQDNAGNNIFKLNGAAGGTLTATIGDATGGGTASGVIGSSWVWVEIHLRIHSSTGLIEVKFDGSSVYSYSGNTDPDTRTNAAKLRILTGQLSSSYHVDDVMINDTTGSHENSWVGDQVVRWIKPNGNGSASQLTNSSGNSTNNYTYVDDNPHDGDSTYVSASTTALKDEYALETVTLPTGAVITVIEPSAIARRIDAATASNIDVGIKSGATEDFASPQALTTTYALYRGTTYYVDPDDSADWDATKLAALEVGIQSS